MKHHTVSVLLAAGMSLVATAALGQLRLPGWAQPYGQAQQTAGKQIFSDHCASCHALKRGQRGFGPSLFGVINRPAGSVPGFTYSDALKRSGIIWTEDNLRKWIANNSAMVSNILMPHVSISDPAEQAYLVAFLRTLKPLPGSIGNP